MNQDIEKRKNTGDNIENLLWRAEGDILTWQLIKQIIELWKKAR